MNPLIVMAYTKKGHLEIISAHASYELALERACEVMDKRPSLHKPPDPWKENPRRLLGDKLPGRLVKAWSNDKWILSDRDLSSLLIVELEVEGTILDQLAAV
jgi:hypothetical protein